MLDELQIRRYARHIVLPEVGGRGQERLLGSAVAIEIGPGRAAGVVAVAYLAAAGVGRLILTGQDSATVDGPLSADEAADGILYGVSDVGQARLAVLRRRIEQLNPDVVVTADAPETADLRLDCEAGDEIGGAAGVADALVIGGRAAARAIVRLVGT